VPYVPESSTVVYQLITVVVFIVYIDADHVRISHQRHQALILNSLYIVYGSFNVASFRYYNV